MPSKRVRCQLCGHRRSINNKRVVRLKHAMCYICQDCMINVIASADLETLTAGVETNEACNHMALVPYNQVQGGSR